MTVLDASAILAFLGGEAGHDQVGRVLARETCLVSAVNWSEVWQKALQHSLPLSALHALANLVDIVDVDRAQAERAASLWSEAPNLSIADRMCLALAAERRQPALTADRAKSSLAGVQIVLIR